MNKKLFGLSFFLWIFIISPDFVFGNSVTYHKDYTNHDVLILRSRDKNIIKPGIHFFNSGTVQAKGEGILFSANHGDLPGIFCNQPGSSLVKSGGSGRILIGAVDFKDTFGTIEAQAGTIEFNGNFSNFNGTAFIGSGKIKIACDACFQGVQSDNLILAGGTYTGDKKEALNGTVIWSGGQFAGGLCNKADLIVVPGGNTRIADGGFFYNSWIVEAAEDGLILSAADNSRARGIFYNQPGGSLIKSGGIGTTLIGDVDFRDDHGTVEAQTGTIEFSSGFANFTGTLFTGDGQVKITNDAYFKRVQSDNLILAGGTYTGYAGDALNGSILWTGGRFAGSFRNNADITWQNGQVGGFFYNYGRMMPDPAGGSVIADNGRFYNYGLLEAAGDGRILSASDKGGTRGIFYNQKDGSLIKFNGTGRTVIGDVDFRDDHGTVEAQTGTIEFSGGFANFTGTLFTGDGQVKITNDAYFKSVQSDNLELAGGTYTGFTGDSLNGSVRWTGGRFAGNFRNNADLLVSGKDMKGLASNSSFLNQGIFQGSGVIKTAGAQFHNYGILAPGDPQGKLKFKGDYHQMSAGSLEIEVVSAEGHDMLDISGTAGLSGKLDIFLKNGFTPVPGMVFDILRAKTISGKFSSVSVAPLPKGLTWKIEYLLNKNGPDGVRLIIHQDK